MSFTIKAQKILFPSPNFQAHHLLYFGYSNSSSSNELMMHQNNTMPKQLPPISSGSINDLPFFCAMECKVRKHTYIWIKLRAGDDASYMRMINSTSR